MARQCLPHQISLKQLHLLRLLKKGPLSPMQAARELFCDKPTASVVLGNLIKRGWAERHANEQDRRGACLLITRAGLEKLESMEAGGGLLRGHRPQECLNAEERETLRVLLLKIYEHLNANLTGENHDATS